MIERWKIQHANIDAILSLLKDLNWQIRDEFRGAFIIFLSLLIPMSYCRVSISKIQGPRGTRQRNTLRSRHIFINTTFHHPSLQEQSIFWCGTVRSISAYCDSNAPSLAKDRLKFADGRPFSRRKCDVLVEDAVATLTGASVRQSS